MSFENAPSSSAQETRTAQQDNAEQALGAIEAIPKDLSAEARNQEITRQREARTEHVTLLANSILSDYGSLGLDENGPIPENLARNIKNFIDLNGLNLYTGGTRGMSGIDMPQIVSHYRKTLGQ